MGKIEGQVTDILPEKGEKGSKTNLNRSSRNKSEKDRRDKVNAFINELADLVPGCSPHSKKLDKATILKNTVDFMKVHNDLTVAITRKDTTSCLSSNELGQLMFEGYHAFLFVISLSGSFKFLSESVYDLLGYMKDELFHKNIFDYILPEDKLILIKQLSQDCRTGIARNSGSSSFYMRMKPKLEDDENPFYETLCCCGNFRIIKEEVNSTEDGDTIISSNETCFVVLAKLLHPDYHRDVSNWLSIDVEFTSRQSLDGRFLYLDPRCIPITGYLPYEILGSMMYEFIHFDDLENVSTSFESLLEDGEGETGNYRIITKGCQWIVIKTNSYISYNHWNSKPEFICSTHQLVRNPSKFTIGRMNTGAGSGAQVEETSTAAVSKRSPLWKIENSDDDGNDVMSELITSNTVNPTSVSRSPAAANMQVVGYSTAQATTSLGKINKGNTNVSQTASQQNLQTFSTTSPSFVQTTHKQYPQSARMDGNLLQNSQQSNVLTREVAPHNRAVETSPQSPDVASNYWSGQSATASSNNFGINCGFQNPLAVIPQSPQHSDRFPSSAGNFGNVRIDGYPQSPRASQGYTEPRAQTPNRYPHISVENTPNVWPVAAHTQATQGAPNELPLASTNAQHGYFAPSPLVAERTFPQARRLSSVPQSASSFPGTGLPRSSSPGENFPASPASAHVANSQVTADGRYPQSPASITAEYPVTPTRLGHSYPKSPPRVSSSSPHSQPASSDGYFSASSLSPTSPHTRMIQGYPQSTTQYPPQSPQAPAVIADRYNHSSSPFPPVSPHPSSPYPSVSPNSPDNSNLPSQSPPYTAQHLSPAKSHHNPGVPNEMYASTPMTVTYPASTIDERRVLAGSYLTPHSSTNYPQSPYDHPNIYPQTSAVSTEKYVHSAVPPHPICQNNLIHPKSPENNPLGSPVLHPVRLAPPSIVDNMTQFPLQAVQQQQQQQQQHVTALYHQTQVKKSGGESFRPCQVDKDVSRNSPAMTGRSSAQLLNRNYQSSEKFPTCKNKQTRSQSLELFPPSRTDECAPKNNLSVTSKMQNINYKRQSPEQQNVTGQANLYLQEPGGQNYHLTQDQTFSLRLQSPANTSMVQPKNTNTDYVKAQRILQDQLLEKQNHLQNIIQNQKAQLSRIQEQIILNAQAQFSLHEISDLECTRQLQQQAYDLEMERNRQEARQGDLKSVFLQKFNGPSDHRNEVEMNPSAMSSTSVVNPRLQLLQHDSNVPQSPGASQGVEKCNTNTYFAVNYSSSEANVSRNISQKTSMESPSGSCEFVKKSRRSPQDARQTSLSREFSEEETFNDVLPPDSGHTSIPGHYYTPAQVLTQPNNVVSFDESNPVTNTTVNTKTRKTSSSSSSQAKDYFSKFSARELETFLSTPSFQPTTGTSTSTRSTDATSEDDGEKEETTSPASTYDSLLLQQKRLLEMQEEQRRQLVRRQQEQLLRLQQQQQQQQRMLLELQHTSDNTQQAHDNETRNLESQILSQGAEDANSVFSHELSDEDLGVVNMLLAEEAGTELWTNDVFDKTTSAT